MVCIKTSWRLFGTTMLFLGSRILWVSVTEIGWDEPDVQKHDKVIIWYIVKWWVSLLHSESNMDENSSEMPEDDHHTFVMICYCLLLALFTVWVSGELLTLKNDGERYDWVCPTKCEKSWSRRPFRPRLTLNRSNPIFSRIFQIWVKWAKMPVMITSTQN